MRLMFISLLSVAVALFALKCYNVLPIEYQHLIYCNSCFKNKQNQIIDLKILLPVCWELLDQVC